MSRPRAELMDAASRYEIISATDRMTAVSVARGKFRGTSFESVRSESQPSCVQDLRRVGMLSSAVLRNTIEGKSVVITRQIFEAAIKHEGSGITLLNQTPQTQNEPEASESCYWWRRGRVEL